MGDCRWVQLVGGVECVSVNGEKTWVTKFRPTVISPNTPASVLSDQIVYPRGIWTLPVSTGTLEADKGAWVPSWEWPASLFGVLVDETFSVLLLVNYRLWEITCTCLHVCTAQSRLRMAAGQQTCVWVLAYPVSWVWPSVFASSCLNSLIYEMGCFVSSSFSMNNPCMFSLLEQNGRASEGWGGCFHHG